jgi:nitroimidazol reductase NimA-like FMN-containing flavoprotein (pyridoxamine 5'-phosphate oxidase superfamily)
MIDHQADAQQRVLDSTNCLLLLGSQHVGRLVLPGDVPFIVPVNYAVIDGSVHFRTDAGSVASRAGGGIAVFEVDVVDETGHAGWSVVVRGVLEDVTASASVPDEWRSRLEPWAPGPKDRWMRLSIEEMTGRWVRGEQVPWAPDARGYL